MAEVDPQPQPSLGSLVQSASRDISTLIRGEIDLAKSDVKQSVKAGTKGGAFLSLALLFLFMVVILISLSLAFALHALGLWLWLSFFVVAALYLAGAALFAWLGKDAFANAKPGNRAKTQLQETVAVLKPSS